MHDTTFNVLNERTDSQNREFQLTLNFYFINIFKDFKLQIWGVILKCDFCHTPKFPHPHGSCPSTGFNKHLLCDYYMSDVKPYKLERHLFCLPGAWNL